MNEKVFFGLIRLPLAMLLFLSVTTLGCAAASTNNSYERGMKAFSARDYKGSDTLFNDAVRSDPSNANAMYMDGLSLQQLGNSAKAIVLYKTVMDRFPDSAACIRSQEALSRLDPKYVQRWRVAHPPRVTQLGLGPLEGKGISPDFSWGNQPLTAEQQHRQESLLFSGQPVDARIDGIETKVQLNGRQPYTYIGFNFLQEANQRFSKTEKIHQATVFIERVRCAQFPFHTTARTTEPIILGKDFEEAYKRSIAMANYPTAMAYLTAHQRKKEKNGESKIASASAEEPLKPNEERFEVHYTTDSDGNRIITVQVNGSTVDMIYGGASGMLMGPEQVRAIDPNLVPDLKSESINAYSIRNSGTVIFRTVAVGKVVRYDVPCRIEGYTGVRNPIAGSAPRAYPILGSGFFTGWTETIDDQRRVIRVSRIKEGPSSN